MFERTGIRLLGLAVLTFLLFAAAAAGQDIDHFSKQLENGNSEQKRDAIQQLRNLRTPEASRAAVPALKDVDPIVRASAAAAIVFLPKIEASTQLTPLLNDRDEFVRREAAYALAEIGDSSVTPRLILLIKNERSIEVRNAVTIALGATGDISAIATLTLLLNEKSREDNEFTRRSAARSIGRIAQIVSGGGGKVITPQNFLPSKYKEIESSRNNGKINEFDAVAAVLIKILSDRSESNDIRREAAFALGSIGTRSAVAALSNAKTSDDPYLAEISKEALMKIEARPDPFPPK